ncbi:hypothetical protein [uncultured Jatrophihabitans sp.]|uniref:hypothetical protein n=1 Tax=uncultured Jatrophihabitans sp. TaxID=1610747 RepID=UPI0035CC6E11
MAAMVVFSDSEPKKNAGQLGLSQLPTAQMSEYQFPAGPASQKIVYIAHPLSAKTLIPFAQFNETIVNDKFNEAVRIMQMLGASEIVSRSVQSDSRAAEVTGRFGKIRAQFGGQRGLNTQTNFHHRGAGSPPEDPAPLRWPSEAGFEAARLGVLKNRSTMVAIEIDSSADFQAESQVAAGLKKLGFSLGVEVKRTRTHSFKITAYFPGTDGPTYAPDSHSSDELPDEPSPKRLLGKRRG